MRYKLEFRRGGKGHYINPDLGQGKAIVEALNKMNVVRTRMTFEALGQKFRIIGREKHGDYIKIQFMRDN